MHGTTTTKKKGLLFSGYKNLFSHSNLERKATYKLVARNNVWSETSESEILILHYSSYIEATMLLRPILWYHTSLSPLQVGPWTAKHAPPLAVKLSFIPSITCLTTGPTPLPKWFLHIVRSRASSFQWDYPLLSLSSSSSFLHLLVTSISPFIFPIITCFRR